MKKEITVNEEGIAYIEFVRQNGEKYIALVDNDLWHELTIYKWCYHTDGYSQNDRFGSMHRHVYTKYYKITNKKNKIDHINGNPLDNRIINLREATPGENCQNKSVSENAASKYLGVTLRKHFVKKTNSVKIKYIARIRYNNKLIYLGCFNLEIEAAKAYNEKATELYKTNMRLNVIN